MLACIISNLKPDINSGLKRANRSYLCYNIAIKNTV
jgi:hypothetical protein